MNLTPNFTTAEFTCHHCGAAGIKQAFVDQLQLLRDAIGKPITITSGYRCLKHPVEANKATPGQHTKGIAADLHVPGLDLKDLYLRVRADFPQFKGIGVALHQGFIHLDTRSGPPALWAYNRNGKDVRWAGQWEKLPKS